WSLQRATQAAQKLPTDWENLCEKSFFRKVYAIKEEDIPSSLFVNSDQTQVVYAPGGAMTWTETGAKQAPVVGKEEKRAFTAMVSVSCSGILLPIQAIYVGKTNRAVPSSDAEKYTEAAIAGFLFEPSGTSTYWSNQHTMRSFVDKILAPYFQAEKEKLGLPETQKSLWSIDLYSVHRSKELRTWINKHHPSIILDYIPGGCT
ncbi:hypothetical protein BD779DRAFT_1410588, partial [Infundibulicybe gibba]